MNAPVATRPDGSVWVGRVLSGLIVLFIGPLMVGIFVWVALFLRDAAIRKLLPLVS